MQSRSLEKIPYNSIIMNIFSEFVWQMSNTDRPEDEFFVVRGMPQFHVINCILSRTYTELVEAHNRGFAFLEIEPLS